MDCENSLESISQNNKATLMWVSGYNVIEDNERADEITRKREGEVEIYLKSFCVTAALE